jgi:hypothetical protein
MELEKHIILILCVCIEYKITFIPPKCSEFMIVFNISLTWRRHQNWRKTTRLRAIGQGGIPIMDSCCDTGPHTS